MKYAGYHFFFLGSPSASVANSIKSIESKDNLKIKDLERKIERNRLAEVQSNPKKQHLKIEREQLKDENSRLKAEQQLPRDVSSQRKGIFHVWHRALFPKFPSQ